MLPRNARETVNSFRRLTLEEIQAARPLRIKVITVQPGDTGESLSHRMAGVEEEEREVLALLEVADLVGETPPAHVVVEELRRAVLLEDGLETLLDRLDAFVRDLRLDDERELVFPHRPSPWTEPAAPSPRSREAPAVGRLQDGD